MSKSGKTLITSVILLGVSTALFLLSQPGKYYSYRKPSEQNFPAGPQTTTLFVGGDIMLSRNVGSKITAANDPRLPFAGVFEKIEQASLAFANLESPFLDQGPRVTEGMVFKAEPGWVAGLSQFEVLQTANNHSADRGASGLLFTNQLLEENEISSVGTGENCAEGTIVEKNGIRFGFLAYSYAGYNDGGKEPNPLVCDWNDARKVAADIAMLRPRVDVLIVAPHMGAEYQRQPQQGNIEKARAAIDAGADLIIGTHPHWIQPLEQYKNGWIFYSLGNFVFDQMWSQDTREGLTALLTYKDKALSKIELAPVIIEDYCCPRWANETETKNILNRINLTSEVVLDKN